MNAALLGAVIARRRRRVNLLTVSEGPLSAITNGGTPAVAEEAGTDGFLRWLRFAGPPTDGQYVYISAANGFIADSVYNISVFVRMDDGGAPSVGFGATNDFALFLTASGLATTVVPISTGLYRVFGTATAAITAQDNNGIVKYTENSNRGFRASGFQITPGPGLQPYQRRGN